MTKRGLITVIVLVMAVLMLLVGAERIVDKAKVSSATDALKYEHELIDNDYIKNIEVRGEDGNYTIYYDNYEYKDRIIINDHKKFEWVDYLNPSSWL